MRRLGKKLAEPAQLLIFARAPVPGRCKTRLVHAQGARGAAAVHRRLMLRTVALAAGSEGLDGELWCEPHAGHACFHGIRRRHGLPLRRQSRGDLGRKMGRALADALGRGAKKVLLVGTDCAALAPQDLLAALAALDTHDCVLQPAQDGGYVLIGARRPLHAALRRVDWSSGRELAQTRSRLVRAGISHTLLRPLWDVDHPADLRRARRAGLL